MNHAQQQLIDCFVWLSMTIYTNAPEFARIWRWNNKYHSFADIPSAQRTNDNEWHKHGVRHRAGGRPAARWRFQDGMIYHG